MNSLKSATLLTLMGIMAWGLQAQNMQMILMEEFTNASCNPCASQNPYYNALLDANTDKVISLKWQAPFPGFDPFNNDNPTELNARFAYYMVNGVPLVFMNGILPPENYANGAGNWGNAYEGAPAGFSQAVLDFESQKTTPLSIAVSHTISDDLSTIDATVVVTNDGDDDFSLTQGRLRIVLAEHQVVFPTAPGHNGEVEFSDVVIKALNGSGETLAAIPAGQSVTVNLSEALPSFTYVHSQLYVAAFVQDDSDRSVHQAAKSSPQPILGDNYVNLGIVSMTGPSIELDSCARAITPMANVTNTGENVISAFDVSYAINGGTPVTESWSGSLVPGASETISFPEITLPSNNNKLIFSVVGGAGLYDTLTIDNTSTPELYSSISAQPISNGYDESNENYDTGTHPSISVVEGVSWIFTVKNTASFNLPPSSTPIGGYGNSDKSIHINFYQWDPSDYPPQASMTYDKISLTDVTQTQLTFDRAGATYQDANDGLEVFVSTDCGDNWTSVWSASGVDLTTAGHHQNPFIPEANQWETTTIDLSAYDNAEELLLRFTATTDWGNSLFLDNIRLGQENVGNENVNLLEGVEMNVSPNPVTASGKAYISLEMAKSQTLDIAIYDAMGRLVRNLQQGSDFASGQTIIEWDMNSNEGRPVSHGLYFVHASSQKGKITTKIMVGN